MMQTNRLCRYCGAELDQLFADLGETPFANSYTTPEVLARIGEKRYPLRVFHCSACHLVQTDETPIPEAIFAEDYAYFSSYSTSWVAQAKRYAEATIERFSLDSSSTVIEIASNDGYLLQHFHARDIPVMGVEPTASTARAAIAKGITTQIAFFGIETAAALREERFAADLMVANNVLAHVPDIHDFLAGFTLLLRRDGVLTLEFPHILSLIRGGHFDTIYHEHYSYLSLLFVEHALGRAGLRVFDLEGLPTQGGSLRVFAAHCDAPHRESSSVEACRELERQAKLDQDEGYAGFQDRIDHAKDSFQAFLLNARKAGRRVGAYGAAAKGNTLLNVCGATADDVIMVADKNPHKQGKLLPGSHIPVVAPTDLIAARPHDVIILPWNIADEIQSEMEPIRRQGGRFIVAIPETRPLP
jgi:hypothetical protein